jgi:hypothetical protein
VTLTLSTTAPVTGIGVIGVFAGPQNVRENIGADTNYVSFGAVSGGGAVIVKMAPTTLGSPCYPKKASNAVVPLGIGSIYMGGANEMKLAVLHDIRAATLD